MLFLEFNNLPIETKPQIAQLIVTKSYFEFILTHWGCGWWHYVDDVPGISSLRPELLRRIRSYIRWHCRRLVAAASWLEPCQAESHVFVRMSAVRVKLIQVHTMSTVGLLFKIWPNEKPNTLYYLHIFTTQFNFSNFEILNIIAHFKVDYCIALSHHYTTVFQMLNPTLIDSEHSCLFRILSHLPDHHVWWSYVKLRSLVVVYWQQALIVNKHSSDWYVTKYETWCNCKCLTLKSCFATLQISHALGDPARRGDGSSGKADVDPPRRFASTLPARGVGDQPDPLDAAGRQSADDRRRLWRIEAQRSRPRRGSVSESDDVALSRTLDVFVWRGWRRHPLNIQAL